jgi:hypothetical protein
MEMLTAFPYINYVFLWWKGIHRHPCYAALLLEDQVGFKSHLILLLPKGLSLHFRLSDGFLRRLPRTAPAEGTE